MNITFRIPLVLRAYSDAPEEIVLEAASVRAALALLEQSHPALHRSICDETGKVRPHVNLFVNADHVRGLNGLDTALAPGDVLWFLTAVSGG